MNGEHPKPEASRTPEKRLRIRRFTDALRKDGGWTLDHDSRSGGVRCRIFVKQVTKTRRLELQLWDDGLRRVSFTERRRMSTAPTTFLTPSDMLAAIKYESVREAQ